MYFVSQRLALRSEGNNVCEMCSIVHCLSVRQSSLSFSKILVRFLASIFYSVMSFHVFSLFPSVGVEVFCLCGQEVVKAPSMLRAPGLGVLDGVMSRRHVALCCAASGL